MENLITGGWSIPETPEVTDEARKIFEDAVSDLDGSKMVPFAYLGSQLVSGMLYKFVVRVSPVSPHHKFEKLSICTIHQSFPVGDKKPEIRDVTNI
ncbi:hypothetical protein D920_01426 [Enterococcus faecalis 13-SD-W-01]|nr:hypothetical protein D920_01426 [Enterococcus faecalis 13-SD-W-01]